jgi:hypothetical protein
MQRSHRSLKSDIPSLYVCITLIFFLEGVFLLDFALPHWIGTKRLRGKAFLNFWEEIVVTLRKVGWGYLVLRRVVELDGSKPIPCLCRNCCVVCVEKKEKFPLFPCFPFQTIFLIIVHRIPELLSSLSATTI